MLNRHTHRISSATCASMIAIPPMAAYGRGSSRKKAGKSKSGSTANLSSTTSTIFSKRPSTAFGLAYVPEEIALPHIAKGQLKRVLEKWSPYWQGYHLYYPSRRQSSPAFVALVEALRHRG